MLVLSSKLKFSSFIFHQHMPNWLLDNKILFYNYLLNLNLLPPFILPYLHENTESVSHSVVSNCVTPQTVAHQASLSMEFSRQGYWSGQPFPSPADLPIQGLNPGLLNCRLILYHLSHQAVLLNFGWQLELHWSF